MTSAITASNGSNTATPIGGVAAGQQSAALGVSGGFTAPGLGSPVRSGPGNFAGLLAAKERLHLKLEGEQSTEEGEQTTFGSIDPKVVQMEEEDGDSSGESEGQSRGSLRIANPQAAVAASVGAQAEGAKRELAAECAVARPDAERVALLAAKTFILAVDALAAGAIKRPALFATMQTISNELAKARLCLPGTPAELFSIVSSVRDGLPPAAGVRRGDIGALMFAALMQMPREASKEGCVHVPIRHVDPRRYPEYFHRPLGVAA
ncbi:hypothetical protein BH10PSE18_BH10PSE18_23430 [soil metagenome]